MSTADPVAKPKIINKLKSIKHLKDIFTLAGIYQYSKNSPKTYYGYALFFTLAGFLYLFVLPVSALYLPFLIYQKVTIVNHEQGWFDILFLTSLFFAMLALSYSLLCLKFRLPSGMEMKTDKQPLLFKEIATIQKYYGNIKIHRVVVNDSNSIQVIKTPRRFLPLFFINTLVIGLPMMQCTSRDYFKVQLVIAIGKLRGQHNYLLSKLYFFSHCWQQYVDSCRHKRSIVYTILGIYLNVYNKAFHRISVGIRYQYNLEADRYALDLIDDCECARAIAYDHILKNYLSKNYWPEVGQIVSKYKESGYSPFASMPASVDGGIRQYDMKSVIERLTMTTKRTSIESPTFQERLDHLGTNQGLEPDLNNENSAQDLLGPTYQIALKVLDNIWLKNLENAATNMALNDSVMYLQD